MQPVARAQIWIFRQRKTLLPNPDGSRLASECGHVLTPVFEEILETPVTWMWSYLKVHYRPAPLPWIDHGCKQCIPGSRPVSFICVFCHLLGKIMLSCKTGQQKHRQEPTSSQGLPGQLGVPHPISWGTLTFIDSSELQQLVLILLTQRTEEQEAPTQLTCKKKTARNV